MDDLKKVLEQARSIIAAGWNQGGYTDGHGNYCLKGAIGIASGVLEDTDGLIMHRNLDLPVLRVERKAMDRVLLSLPQPFDSVPAYNDDPSTTKDDVLAVLDKAIASC